jgi:hypothetical protein
MQNQGNKHHFNFTLTVCRNQLLFSQVKVLQGELSVRLLSPHFSPRGRDDRVAIWIQKGFCEEVE